MDASFTGQLIRPGDPAYDAARRVRNPRADREPALIARCADVTDVVAVVRYARRAGLPIAVRGGGANVAGWGTCDGGVVIDLSLMRRIEIAPESRMAIAEPGVTWGEFDAATQRHGLALPGPRNPDVGIAGHTLGGGVGDISRMYGLTSDNVVSFDLVTAAGERVRASATENRDLFWGLRGGGGNFGVVTTFTYRLHPVAGVVAGPLLFPAADAEDVLRRTRDWLATAPDAASVVALVWTAPPLEFIPEPWQFERCVVLVPTWFGNPDRAETVLDPLRRGAVSDRIRPMRYVDYQRLLPSPPNAHQQQVYNRGELLDELSDATIASLLAQWRAAGPNFSLVFGALGGAISRAPAGPTAFVHRHATWFVEVCAQWFGAPDSEPHLGPARRAWQSLADVSSGPYVNLLPDPEPEWVDRAYGPTAVAALADLKRQWDPGNVFRFNANVAPDLGVHR
ncbi:FAD-binding oxidoreductase [Nocardia sp. NPDC058658]|uniref:FAD-binding oxidoreductase n=1 Tax=Nocardia sp. NPDC058658 TaxID=3346580 RepID=UPI0036625FD7